MARFAQGIGPSNENKKATSGATSNAKNSNSRSNQAKTQTRQPSNSPKPNRVMENKKELDDLISKIGTLTQTKKDLENKLEDYNEAKKQVSNALESISKSIDSVSQSIRFFSKYYVINGKAADGNKLTTYKTDLEGYKNKLNNTIIPKINSKIASLTAEINSLNSQIGKKEKRRNELQGYNIR